MFVFILLLFNLILFSKASNVFRKLYLARFLYAYYIIEIIIAVVIIFLDHNYILPGCSFFPQVRQLTSAWSLTVIIAGIAIFTGMYLACQTSNYYQLNSFSDWYEETLNDNRIGYISITFAWIFLLAVLFPFIPKFPYHLRIITLSFDFLPIFVGLYLRCLPYRHRILWFILLFINMFANLVQGSRGLAIIPIALFVIGYLISIYKQQKFKYVVILLLIISPPFFSFFGEIQDYRNALGRGNDVNIENASIFIDYIESGTSKENETLNIRIADGLSRFLNIGDFAIVNMTPKIVNHRGFVQFGEELKSIITLHGAEGSQKFKEERGSLQYGSGILTNYGFYVNEETSVGLGILGDSFSRFGYMGVFIYTLILSFFISKIEMSIRLNHQNILGLIIFLFLSYTFLYTIYGNSYFVFLKKIIFNGTLVLVITYLLFKQYKK